ncbi:DMT family transporter [Phaeovulum sp. W22_SRMD_FR3]|uniref:DMT family transporter n=1 Tax=Phaeovulum sp. W22_SRMD_FR3 TaxID=3240274 RepID=UPI003F99E4C5
MATAADNVRGASLMIGAMAAFCLNDTLMKAVTQEVPLYQAIFLRGLMMMPMLAVMLYRSGPFTLRLAAGDRGWMALRLLGEVLATIFFMTALQHMPLANLSAILQSLPLLVTLAATLFWGEPLGWRRSLAVGLGFIGVMLIIRPGADFDRWAIFALLAVLAVLVRDMVTRQMSASLPTAVISLYAAVAVTLLGAIISPFQGWAGPGIREILGLAGAAVALLLGYTLIIGAMRVGDVGVVAPFRYTSLLFALVLGWLIFGSFPDALTLVGAGLVVATGIYTFFRERRLARQNG